MRNRALALLAGAALTLASTDAASAQAVAEDSKGAPIVLLNSTSAGINAARIQAFSSLSGGWRPTTRWLWDCW